MEIDFKKLLRRESWALMTRQIKSRFMRIPRWLLIKHGHAFNLAAVALVMLVAFWLVLGSLYSEPSKVSVAPVSKKLLLTNLIDQTILWMEERETESKKELEVTGDLFEFKL